jgi:cysteine-rich repeat protein
MRRIALSIALLLAAIGCQKNEGSSPNVQPDERACADCGPGCGDRVECWCPNPQCEREGCLDGVLSTCVGFGGDCNDQGPIVDCTAQGLTCWDADLGSLEPGTEVASCAPAGCGDAVVQSGEACDDGRANGTRLNGCSSACTLPVPAERDQRHAAEDGEPLAFGMPRHLAYQTFTAEKSGRLAWIVADMPSTGLFVLQEGDFVLLARASPASGNHDGRHRYEHHFLHPVFVEAGKQYAFDLRCWSDCEVEVTRGDRYAGGGLVFAPIANQEMPAPPPADADVPFDTWVIEEDDGCHLADAPFCPPPCGGLEVAASCSAGAWQCPAVYEREWECLPRYDEVNLELVAEIGGGGGEPVDVGGYLHLELRPETPIDLARIELPGTRFEGGWPSAQILFANSPAHLAWGDARRTDPRAPYVFDLEPPLRLDAGQAYRLTIWGVAAVPISDGSGPEWIDPWIDGGAVPLRLWKRANP